MSDDLHWLAETGQVDEMRRALEAGASVDARDEEGRTALHVAVARGTVEPIRILLDAGADPEAPGNQGETVVHAGARGCDSDAMHLILDHGGRADTRDEHGRTPLHVAALRGAVREIDALLGGGGEERTARQRLEDEHVIRALLQAGAPADGTDERGVTALHLAAGGGVGRTVQQLLEHGAAPDLPDAEGGTALHRATSVEITQMLLDGGASLDPVDRDGHTPLLRAIGAGRIKVADLLLERGEFVIMSSAVENAAIENEEIAEGRLVVILPEGHALARQDAVSARDIAEEDLIGVDPDDPYGRLLARPFEVAGITPPHAMRGRFAQTLVSMVRHGLGVAVIDEFSVAEVYMPGLERRPLVEDVRVKSFVSRKKGRVLSGFAEFTIAQFRRELGRAVEDGPWYRIKK